MPGRLTQLTRGPGRDLIRSRPGPERLLPLARCKTTPLVGGSRAAKMPGRTVDIAAWAGLICGPTRAVLCCTGRGGYTAERAVRTIITSSAGLCAGAVAEPDPINGTTYVVVAAAATAIEGRGLGAGLAIRYTRRLALPLTHSSPSAQGLKQLPQCLSFLLRFTHLSLQRVWPWGQPQTLSSPRLMQFLEQHWESLRHSLPKRLQSLAQATPGMEPKALRTRSPPSI